ncbi:hypothetical protein L3Q82_005279 [Scortum barcoo]|uniref:Uncharacterized protein n=1 Tax=Scortum barcoo TaxID=214431 RepID=A0ACB8V9W4_9TELE|nr:hypothetical protein L3Q82_005279 [Scortum barcoo]
MNKTLKFKGHLNEKKNQKLKKIYGSNSEHRPCSILATSERLTFSPNAPVECDLVGWQRAAWEFSTCKSHALCQNLSNPKTPGQEDGTFGSQVGHKELNEILTVQPRPEDDQQRPFAQLIGSGNPEGADNVVQWVHEGGESVMKKMSYNEGKLLVEKDGHYYLYSKVTVNAADECLRIQHKVMKTTKAYGHPIELMKSNSYHCQTQKHSQAKAGGDLWNSFLAGIFHLHSGDEVFVVLDHIQKIRPGTTENLMGAFMISP